MEKIRIRKSNYTIPLYIVIVSVQYYIYKKGLGNYMNDIEIILISSLIGAALSLIVSVYIMKREVRFEMRWTIYNTLINELHEARKIVERYSNELSDILSDVSRIDEEAEIVSLNLDFRKLQEIVNDFLWIRNHFLLYSKMYQAKEASRLINKIKSVFSKGMKTKNTTSFLLECNERFHEDHLYLNEVLQNFYTIKSECKGMDNYDPIIKKKLIDNVRTFTWRNIKIKELDEMAIYQSLAKEFKSVI
ncbi:hypothetical protein [Breznakia pachnodae]|uniref:Uncharacterized protein n=1 Tax=Breznakia pachnodae TaxID=265178 RepID=A0ABU0E6X4_9FIRM|nr:hypothetical protein [Breznakia pachnodae]MDQ0362466.1 hypothetical protein [Breznakia pachnodae]